METKTAYITDIHVVAIDETAHWTDKKLVKKCGKISTVYMFDKSVTTNCCELTPSYELTPLYYITEKQVSDEIHEELQDIFWKTETEPRYFHCNGIDKMKTVKCNQSEFEFETADSDEYKEHFEEMKEYLNGNHLI